MSQQAVQDRTISRQRLMQILRRRQPETSAQATAASSAPLFDWTCPHHFDPQGWSQMQNLGKRIAAAIENTLGPMCLEEPKVTMKKAMQDFAYVLAEQTIRQEKPQYFLPFSAQDKRAEGFLGIQPEAAKILITQLLRDSEASVGQSGPLSTLEEFILQDAATGITEAILAVFQGYGQVMLKQADSTIRVDWPLEARQLQDLCGFTFTVTFPKQTIELTMLVVGEVFDAVLGTERHTRQKPLNPAELSRKILRQLYDAPVEVAVRLCHSSVRMEDLMSLETGDVLILGKKTTEPMETLLNGRVCFYAWPVMCEGKLSLAVSQVRK